LNILKLDAKAKKTKTGHTMQPGTTSVQKMAAKQKIVDDIFKL
jgi:hypothetical protein